MPDSLLFFEASNSRAMKTSMPIAATSKISEMMVPKPPTVNSIYKSYLVNDCPLRKIHCMLLRMNILIFKKLCVLFGNGDRIFYGIAQKVR